MFQADTQPNLRQQGKPAGALRTIGDAAVELEVEPHVLRFWESKFRQVTPVKRRGGRRYYRPEDIALLRRIRTLLYSEGYTIKGVQRMLDDELGVPALRQEITGRPGPHLVDGKATRPLPAAVSDDGSERPEIADTIQDLQDALVALRQALMAS